MPVTTAKQFDTAIRGTFKQLRERNRISQLIVGKTRRISQQSVSNIETGQTKRLSLSGVHDLAIAHGATVTILIEDPAGHPILRAASDQIPDAARFETAVRDALHPLHEKSTVSGADISRHLKVTPGTVSKIKSGAIALNTQHLYGFVEACDGSIAALIHDRNKELVLECFSGKPPEKPASQFSGAAREALHKLGMEKEGGKNEAGEDQGVSKAATSYVKVTKKRGLDTNVLLDYLQLYGAEVTVSVDDAEGRRIKEFSSANLSPTRFNTETRNTLSSLRQGRILSPRQAGERMNIGETAVRIMEDPTRNRGLRLTTIQRYVTAYDGNITFSVRDGKGHLVAEFSSAKRPDENPARAARSAKQAAGNGPEVS